MNIPAWENPAVGPGKRFAAEFRRASRGLATGAVRALAARPEGLWSRKQGWQFHLEPEFFLQLRGGCRFRFPNQRLELTADTLLMLPAGLPHLEKSYRCADGEFANLVLMPGGVHLAAPGADSAVPVGIAGHQTGAVPGCAELRGAMNRVWEWEAGSRDRIFVELCRGLLELLASALELPPPPELERRHPKIEAVTRMIRSRFYGIAPEIGTLAAAVGCTPNYLSGLFRRETGRKISEFINDERLDYARRMLTSTEFRVAEIAWSCGFQDASYFAELYRARFGALPSEARRGNTPTPR